MYKNGKIQELENKLDVRFKNKNLLIQALTHPSYKNEHPQCKGDNERLEFLGDAVLELVVSDFLCHKFPEKPEGELTVIRAGLINYQNLSKVAEKLGLFSYLFLSKGQRKEKGKARESVVSDALEAIIAAIYLDQGYAKSREFIQKNILINLDEIIEKQLYRDSKSCLQELVQEEMKVTPYYRVLQEQGPDHKKMFESGVYFGDKLFATGKGYSKQEAEEKAAQNALNILQNEKK